MNEAKEYRVLITETLQKMVIVRAFSEEEAHRRTEDAWKNTEYTLGAESFQGVEFHVLGETEGDRLEKDLEHLEQKGGDAGV